MDFLRRTLFKLTALGIVDAIMRTPAERAVSSFHASVPPTRTASTCETDPRRRGKGGDMSGHSIKVLAGSTFVISNGTGDIDSLPSEPSGFFYKDTRHLSLWVLKVNGIVPEAMSADTLEYYFVQFFLRLPTGRIGEDSMLSIARKRSIEEGFVEELTLMNHGAEPVGLIVRLEAEADFADLFEVKEVLTKKGQYYSEIREGTLVLGYRRADFVRETWISSSEPPEVDGQALAFNVQLGAKSEWTTYLTIRPVIGEEIQGSRHRSRPAAYRNPRRSLQEWVEKTPSVSAYPDLLRQTYERSMVDLASLRFNPGILPDGVLPAAGLPWFMALFGRDSLITSYQALPFVPELAAATLRMLAARQGREVDRYREEEPGKILHELRFGELTAFGERPHGPYYGTADATPLFLVLLDEYERWTGDAALVRELEKSARAALDWIDRFGDSDGDGYIEYERKTQAGLENQCWKDSWNSIVYPDGRLAPTPRATCEIQGYVYDAKLRSSRFARDIWGDTALADRLAREATDLKRRFNRDFWVVDRECFALALDGAKRQVNTLTSNMGHLLWSGIVDDDKAAPVVRHLMGPDLFSGWGVRTMAESETAYNPIGYHIGTVWPHDCSIVAAGLARYGQREAASEVALALLQASYFFQNRLPEAFAGYDRAHTVFPVEYPTACSPQAWAAGAPLLAFRVLLGLEPLGDELTSAPALPQWIASLRIEDIPGRWGRVTVQAERTDGLSYRDIYAELFRDRAAMSRKQPSPPDGKSEDR
jgi:glycogen debranching enzyme